jgi:hypothetical protein
MNQQTKQKAISMAFSPQANYTDQPTNPLRLAKIVPTLVVRGV